MAAGGGLASYGANVFDQRRGAASYVDRILMGEKPAALPVRAPTKYELVISYEDRKGTRSRNSGDTARWRGRQGRN